MLILPHSLIIILAPMPLEASKGTWGQGEGELIFWWEAIFLEAISLGNLVLPSPKVHTFL